MIEVMGCVFHTKPSLSCSTRRGSKEVTHHEADHTKAGSSSFNAVRLDKGDKLLNLPHKHKSKLVRELSVDKGDTLINCPHPTKCKVSNDKRGDRGNTSASWPRTLIATIQGIQRVAMTEEPHQQAAHCNLIGPETATSPATIETSHRSAHHTKTGPASAGKHKLVMRYGSHPAGSG